MPCSPPTHSTLYTAGPLLVPWAAVQYTQEVAHWAQECYVCRGQLGHHLVLHHIPGQPFSGLSQQLLTQVKHQALVL